MSNVLQIVENEQTSEFYPTPPELVEKMFDGVEMWKMHTILEPSAGKGDILRVLAKFERDRPFYYDVDCIEYDQNLRQILKFNFSDNRKSVLLRRKDEIRSSRGFDSLKCRYQDYTESQEAELKQIESELDTFFHDGIRIVHDDFLTYNTNKQYDLIVMNPPFSNGDKHLLKALKMQETGGNIICLLNAETIRNPYSESRRELMKQLLKYNAQIEYIDNGFVSAERRTGVEIALIRVHIESVQEESEIYERIKKAEMVDDFNPEVTDLEVTDYIKASVNMFNVECKAGIELIKHYKALVPHMLRSFGCDGYSTNSPILRLTNSNDRGYDSVSVNSYLKDVRMKYWRALMNNPKFIGKLTTKLRQDYQRKVAKLADYDFSEFNIYTLLAEMNTQTKKGIEDEIIAMFDRLTAEHTWYKECVNNRHYYDGWKSNKAHKIDKKVIIPCYGVFDSYDGRPRVYNATDTLADIERILNFLDGGMTEDVDMESAIKVFFEAGQTKNIPLKYFKATFYKKGTVHLVFNCPELIERFNIYAAQHKSWLPPSYGSKSYANMTDEEKAVIDSFQGEKAYNEIMAKASYYLAPVTNNKMLMLGA